jgi:NAD(P)-dependent dehydrogenase (short-subunit alcohol dehydrogenase family)
MGDKPVFDFTGCNVIVTGAAGALGSAVARAFRRAGGRVALIDRDLQGLQDLCASLGGDAGCYACVGDLMDESSVAAMVAEIFSRFGRIDVLVNVAGGFSMGPAVHETPSATWDFMLGLNARTVFLMSRAVVPHMLARRSGKIVNVAARAALEGKAKMAAYVASKSAVIRLTESMAAELKDAGIQVNCILPGTIDTPRNRIDMPNADYSRWVPPEALADVILFLASEAARAVTGAAVPVYGRS